MQQVQTVNVPHPSPDEQTDVKEQDRLLPIANVSRIMKRALPENAKMSKEAKTCIQECVSEFIAFITSEASERLQADKRKTITGDDVIDSMRSLGFEAYMAFLQKFLRKFRMSAKGTKPGTLRRGRKRTLSGGMAVPGQPGSPKNKRLRNGIDSD